MEEQDLIDQWLMEAFQMGEEVRDIEDLEQELMERDLGYGNTHH